MGSGDKFFSVTGLLILSGILGNPGLAADIAIVQGAVIAVFLAFSVLVLCVLIGHVVAFRYSSFAYVPAQSYLLFGSIFANLALMYGADRLLEIWYGCEQKHRS